MRRFTKSVVVVGLVLLVSALVASPGEAQRRFAGRTRVMIGGYYGWPFHGSFYGPYYSPFWLGAYSPWGWYDGWGYPQRWVDREAGPRTVAVRTDVSPEETQIYLDGYFVGTAGDFDGPFSRLRMTPGRHEIVLYLKGFKTERQTLQIRPNADQRISQKMVPLAAGEPGEPPPAPPPPPAPAPIADQPQAVAPPEPPVPPAPPGAPQPPVPPRRPAPPDQPWPPRPPVPPVAPVPPEAHGFGAIAIRVQPAGAEVLIDGDLWQGPEGAAPLIVQVAEGRHRVEVRRDGYVTFSTEIVVRQGATLPLNVSLPVRQ